MVQKKKIVEFLDMYLKVSEIPDSSANGLQIDGVDDIKRIGFSVDACFEVFQEAKKKKCDMIVVHHGLFWDKIGPITEALYRRIKVLMENGISLYGAHAPIDKHKEIGNNAELLKIFGLKANVEFGYDHDINWGWMDYLEESISFDEALSKITHLWDEPLVLKYGKDEIKSIAAVSGGAAFAIPEAIQRKVDLLLIGEMKHGFFHTVKEGQLNLIAAGHYNTETLGVKSLALILEKEFNIETIFIDAPTGL